VSEHDVVIAGAGHNSMITAAYLAKAGFSVLVLEARSVAGGDTATEELTLPGFLHDSCSTAHTVLQSSPTIRNDELGLGAYGLEYISPDPVVHIPFPDGSSITQWRDLDRTCAELARYSDADGRAYRSFIEDYERVAPIFNAHRYTPIGLGPGIDERLAAHPDGWRWQRMRRWSAAKVIFDHFEDQRSRAFLLWLAFMTMQPPQRSDTARLAYALPFGRQRHSWIIPAGGSRALPVALGRLIEDHGGTILTNRRVADVVVENGRCVGVETDDGEVHRASKAVVSTIHIKHLVEMATPEVWGEEFRFGVETWRPGITMFAAHYATTEPPRFEDGLTPLAAGTPTSVERLLRIPEDFDRGIVALDDPVLLVLCPTVADPSRAPADRHTLKVIGFQPYDLPEGPEHWDEIKADVAARNLDQLRTYAPNLTEDTILGSAVKSPLDLERMNAHNWHGSCHGGDQGPDQMGELRPAPGWAQHRTPIPGLYQTGATTHPGGSVTGGPGRNAAMVLLQDLGSSLDAAIAG
jgi:phytoene dehydrogenase-like protein